MTDTTGSRQESEAGQPVEELVRYLQQSSREAGRTSIPAPVVVCAKTILAAVNHAYAQGRLNEIPVDALEKAQELGRLLRNEGFQLRDVFQSIVILRKSARDLLGQESRRLGRDIEDLQSLNGRWFDSLVFAAVNSYYEAQRTELQRRIVIDGLTGVFNRGYLQERLNEEIERARRYSHSVTLLMLDVDSMKPINDRYGHMAGDFVLKSISQVLQAQSRLVDVVARYGGDEFAVIMPETSPDGGWVLAERITQGIREIQNDQLRNEISVSIGIAAFPRDADTLEGLIEAADKALYRSKSQGGNTVAAYGGPLGDGEPRNGAGLGRRQSDVRVPRPAQSAPPEAPREAEDDSRAKRLESQNLHLKVSLELARRKMAMFEKYEGALQEVIEECLSSAPTGASNGNGHESLPAGEAQLPPGRHSIDKRGNTDAPRSATRPQPVTSVPSEAERQVADVLARADEAAEVPSPLEARRGQLAAEVDALEKQREQARGQVEAVLKVINELLGSLGDIEGNIGRSGSDRG